jgi:predicted O-methyltransferase YrrM
MKPIEPDQVREIAVGFMTSRVLLTAVELDLFTLIGNGSRTSLDVARDASCDPRGTDRLLNQLVVMGFLSKQDGRFANTPLAAQCLVRGSAGFLGNLAHTAHLWHSWSTLTDAVRKGGSVAWKPGAVAPEGRQAFIAAMHHGATRQAEEVVARLPLTGVRSVLDVGAGSAGWSAAFVRAGVPRVTAFDLPEILTLTQGYIDRAGLSGSIDTAPGDYLTGNLPAGYDLVFMSSILHINSPDENRSLVCAGARSLNPGGLLVVREFLVDQDRTAPPHAVSFALNMLVNTRGGDAYTRGEVSAWMANAGLQDPQHIPFPGAADLLIARKPRT